MSLVLSTGVDGDGHRDSFGEIGQAAVGSGDALRCPVGPGPQVGDVDNAHEVGSVGAAARGL